MSARTLGARLTDHLREVSHDKHIGVRFWPAPAGEQRTLRSEEERRAAARQESAFINYGFTKVERLGGNIGYIELNGFTDAEAGAETVAAVMNFVANTDALIFDLRGNGGGRPQMVALICSYLFGPEPVHLNDLYCRTPIEGLCVEGNHTEEFWTRKEVAGKRYVGKDVYVLTSNRTFSAAEEFAYNLKTLKRATIVGETTGGGANPGTMIRFLADYQLFVPMGRAINPITKTNWDSTGVSPDLEAPVDQALIVAHQVALKKLLPTIKETEAKERLQEEIDQLEKELNRMKARK
jgi:C-terminal processing protease CtpA/Prc